MDNSEQIDTEKLQDRLQGFETLKYLESLDSFEESVSQLEFLLTQPYQWFRICAVEMLAEIKTEQSVILLGIALNDRCEYVAIDAAKSLAKIGTLQALDVLRRAFWDDEAVKPLYLSDAIAQFGREGFDTLKECVKSKSPRLRYFAAKSLGTTGFDDAFPILENLAATDFEKTPSGSDVASGARKGLKNLRRKPKSENS